MGRSVSAAVRNKGVGWADDVVGGEHDSDEAHKAKRALRPTHSQARHARSIAAALEAASARGAALQTVPDAVIARLQQFAAMNAFKREARRVVATYLPEEEVVGLLTLFRHMDTDKDGVVSMEELCRALEQRGVHVPDEHAKVRTWACVV
ncbi:hypothetical protein DUNSADRAFT_4734 [Dunaliella salina]|uniref:EF-hand domain-containing protein n=1 Tax=Dunaliella salina TaxID=3046 RepID=A0ABQ7GRE2_DUNSA|nr:hypothetical protein DUNSADRAFT_4734 [Dunaliella salina]|eukprot:KAF5837174.1 hypothetical protein DUNSADRAFT_4734 [Dunaliella salina]